jgi:threonine/homoserine/homoserine lactone efflux protein
MLHSPSDTEDGVPSDIGAFIWISVIVIVTPGQDTALTIRNTLAGGRAAGVATAGGVAIGQAIWAIATSVGVAALIVASEPLFNAVRVAGAVYLFVLGARTLWAAVRGSVHTRSMTAAASGALEPAAFRQGLLSNLANPKMAVFFTSLLPQFAAPGSGSFLSLLPLGLAFCVMTLAWLTLYAFVVARVGDVLRRGWVRRALDAVLGVVFVGLGLRVATASR